MRRSIKLVGAVSAVLCAVLVVIPVRAQPPMGPGMGGGMGGGMGAGGGRAELLLIPAVQEELELIPPQIERLQEAVERMRTELRDVFGRMQDVPREQRADAMREFVEDLRADAEATVENTLLPHQMTRLTQISNQMQMRGGAMRGLVSGSVADQLNITDEQREKLQARAEQLEAQIRQRMNDLRAQALEMLLQELTPAQREEYRKLVGAPFEMPRQQLGAGMMGGRERGGAVEGAGGAAPRERGRGFGRQGAGQGEPQ